MVAFTQYSHINMNGNEIQNVNAQNLASAPESATAGRFYFNTTNHTLYVYDGTSWVDALNQGKIYTYQNGIEELTGADAGKVQLKIATGDNAGNVVFTANANGLKGQVDLSGKVDKNDAITGDTKCKVTYDNKGLVTAGADLEASDIPNLTLAKITDVTATAAEVNVLDGITASTEELNILDGVTASASEINVLDGITASTAELNIMDGVTVTASDINSVTSKIDLTDLSIASGSTNYLGYDNTTGQFSAKVSATPANNGTDLITTGGVYANTVSAVAAHGTDANKIVVTKAGSDTTITINDVAHATSADQDGNGDNIAETYATKAEIADFIELTDLSVASASANYLTYNNTTGEFGANVDTTVTASSTNLVTSGAVESAISSAIVGGVTYKGTWTISTSTSDYSGITLPVKKGYMYYVAGEGPATVGGVEWNAGDYLLVNADVAAGGSLSGKVEKIDNTESADIVKLNATQTLTNKTIDADDNTITDLETDNFKSGVVTTPIAAESSAADTKLPTEKAVATAIKNFITASSTDTLTNKAIDADDNTISDLGTSNFKSGVIQTTVRATSSASDSAIATEKAVATGLAAKVEKFTAQNTALTATSGVCTWTITNTIGSADVQVALYDVATGAQIGAVVEVGTSNIVVKFNSTANIAADTFKAVVIGL